MGKLEEALENADEGGAQGSGGGGLGGMVGSGGVELQEDNAGTSAKDQVAGEGTLPEGEGGEAQRDMPTSPEAKDAIPE